MELILENYGQEAHRIWEVGLYCIATSITASNARFHMLFGFRPASGRESVPLVCPHCRL